MNIFDFFKQPDINKGLKEYAEAENAVLLDVRTPQEYGEGHNKDTALFVYCYSGARSRQAMAMLQHMGYTNVQNIGGIAAYHGKVER